LLSAPAAAARRAGCTRAFFTHAVDHIYAQLQVRAARRQRTVADEVLDVLTGATLAAEALPDELEDALAQLISVDDAALWQAVRSHMPTDAAERLQELNLKRQREGLVAAEQQESDRLIHHYERSMLIRAQAAALLKQRGNDRSNILVP
jgi:plasmid stability protein